MSDFRWGVNSLPIIWVPHSGDGKESIGGGTSYCFQNYALSLISFLCSRLKYPTICFDILWYNQMSTLDSVTPICPHQVWFLQQGPPWIAQGTLFNVMWQPGWKGSLGENGHIYMYGWVAPWYTYTYHNIVNKLYSNMKFKKIKKEIQFLT